MTYSKTAREAARKLALQEQRAVVIDWELVVRNALDRFVLDDLRCVYATAGGRFRTWNGRGFRRLTSREFGVLWNCVRAEIENQNAKVTIRRITFGLRCVALLAPRAEIVASREVSP